MSSSGARAILAGSLLPALHAAHLGAQHTTRDVVTDAGNGPVTFVLLSGMVGGVAGFRRLEGQLLDRGHRVVVVDPYRLSVDSTDVSFAALARRVNAVLAARGVTSARVVGHAHGAGVALRLAAAHTHRVEALYFIDVGALASNRTRVLSASLRLVPLVARMPGGRRFIRARFLHGLRENSGGTDWLDEVTEDAYVRPVLDHVDRVAAMGIRLSRAVEPDSLPAVVARVRVPLSVLLGAVPHASGPDSAELAALAPLRELLRVERVPGVGHFPHEEAPAEVARWLAAPAHRTGPTVAVARGAGGAR